VAVLHLANGCGRLQSQKYRVLFIAITKRRSLGWKAKEAITVVGSEDVTIHISLPPYIMIMKNV